MSKNLPWNEIGFYADKYDLDAKWIAACVLTESNGNQHTARYEPGYKYLYHPRTFAAKLGISVETETALQMLSVGLMQPMGAVARELGFTGHLGLLYDVNANLDIGVKHLATKFKKYANIEDAIAAYNAGSVRKTAGGMYENQRHVDRFMQHLRGLG